jgi:hypothetical protein
VVPPGSYLKEARFGDTDILDRSFTIAPGTASTFRFVLSSRVSQVEGLVTRGNSQAALHAAVVLVPEGRRDRTDLYAVAATDDRGRYVLRDVAPGNYKAFAWESMESYSWLDPAVLRPYEQQGTVIRVPESSTETLNLSLIAVSGRVN